MVKTDSFEVWNDGIRVTAHIFGMSFFIAGDLRQQLPALAAVQDGWLDFAGRQRFTFYSTETMSKHRKVTPKTLGMLRAWALPDTPPREYVALMLKDGINYNDTGAAVFEVFANPDQDPEMEELTYLHLAIPAAEAADKLDALRKMFLSICDNFPVTSASAGYGIETSPYFQEEGETAAWALSMRHPGLDVVTGLSDRQATGLDGLRTVNWLTAINAQLLADVGGRQAVSGKLPDGVLQYPLAGGGLVLQAGEAPAAGDVNRGDRLPLYAAVDAALRPLIDRCMPRAMQFDVTDNDGTATPRWFRRFAGDG